MRPTLQTVADAVGVSRSTVSNAYSRPDQLSPELRERILDAARRLGYAGPNPTARSLRRGRVGAVGVLFTAALSYAFADPYAVRFLRGLAAAAERHDTGLLLIPVSLDDGEGARTAVQNAAVDGFCVYCVPEWHPAIDAVAARGLPVVGTELRPDAPPGALAAGIDEAAATRAAGHHLIGLGHRRIALLGDHLHTEPDAGPVSIADPTAVRYFATRQRVRGYYEAFTGGGVDWSGVLTVNVFGTDRQAGAEAAAYALDRADRPTAIVALSDVIALGVLDALAARGLAVGRDMSVIGFDDVPEAAAAGLTTIRQPAIEKGRIAGELLLDPPGDPARRRVVLPTELVVRASTGPAPHGRT